VRQLWMKRNFVVHVTYESSSITNAAILRSSPQSPTTSLEGQMPQVIHIKLVPTGRLKLIFKRRREMPKQRSLHFWRQRKRISRKLKSGCKATHQVQWQPQVCSQTELRHYVRLVDRVNALRNYEPDCANTRKSRLRKWELTPRKSTFPNPLKQRANMFLERTFKPHS